MAHWYFMMILSYFSHWPGLERIFHRIELKCIAKYKTTRRRKAQRERWGRQGNAEKGVQSRWRKHIEGLGTGGEGSSKSKVHRKWSLRPIFHKRSHFFKAKYVKTKQLRTLWLVTDSGDAMEPSWHQHKERTSPMQINMLFQWIGKSYEHVAKPWALWIH